MVHRRHTLMGHSRPRQGKAAEAWRRALVAAAGLGLMGATLFVSAGNGVAKVGDIAEFAIPTSNSVPRGIAAGPDGSVNSNSTFSPTGASSVSMAAIPDSLISTVRPFSRPQDRE